jgi:hypothetical protein
MKPTLHLYAVVRPHAVLPALCGIDDQPVRVLPLAGLGVLVSSRQTPSNQQEALQQQRIETLQQQRIEALHHHRVVEAASAVFDSLLPVRFAAPLSLERLEMGLRERLPALHAQLERLTQTCEYTLRATLPATLPPQPQVTPTTGRAYLEHKKAALQIPPEMQALSSEFAELPCLEQRLQNHNQPYRMAFLVQKDNQASFVQHTNALIARHTNRFSSLGLYGAFAPYSFAEVF